MAAHSSILAGESHGQRSLVGYSPWGLKEAQLRQFSRHMWYDIRGKCYEQRKSRGTGSVPSMMELSGGQGEPPVKDEVCMKGQADRAGSTKAPKT